MVRNRDNGTLRRGHTQEITSNLIPWVNLGNEDAIARLRRLNLIVVNHVAPAPPPPAVAPAVPLPGRGHFMDPTIDPELGRERREPRYERRDERRDEPDAREAAGALILNRKVEMFQKKLRHLYLVEATADKVRAMPLEQVKLYIQNAKSIYESYDYVWSMIEDSDRIDWVEYNPDDGIGRCFVSIPRLQEKKNSTETSSYK